MLQTTHPLSPPTMTFLSIIIPILLFSLSTAKLIPLPIGSPIEGVTHAQGSNFFGANILTGDIYLIDVVSNLITTVARPLPNRTSIGLSSTSSLLFAAGGGSVPGFQLGAGPGPAVPALNVYEIVTGRPVASCVVENAGLVNDVDASGGGVAYFTDSSRGVVYSLDIEALPKCKVGTIWLPRKQFSEGVTTANGVVKFRGGIIVANTVLGTMFFIDLRRGSKAQRLVKDGKVVGVDGLALVKRKGEELLYVVQNEKNLVSVWRLGMKKRVVEIRFVKNIESNEFDFPTTVAVGAGRLVVPNSNFDDIGRGTVDIPNTVFTVSAIKQ